MKPFSTLLIGNESLTIQCGAALLARGHRIAALVSRNAEVRAWGLAQGLRVEEQAGDLTARLTGLSVDWLLSVANLHMIPPAVLALARHGCVNFHDGPLPRYAGLNAPVWAILNGETAHGITWHLISDGVDTGDILAQHLFEIAPNETALTLNTKCFEAAIDSFPALLDALEGGTPPRRAQDFTQRSLYARADRPEAAGVLDFSQDAMRVAAQVRALDHDSYFNPLTCAKLVISGQVLAVGMAETTDGSGAAGAVIEASAAGLVVGCAAGAVRLAGLRAMDGAAVCPSTLIGAQVDAVDRAVLIAALASVVPHEAALRRALSTLDPVTVAAAPATVADWQNLSMSVPVDLAALALVRLAGKSVADFALGNNLVRHGILSDWTPLRATAAGTVADVRSAFAAALAKAKAAPAFALDLLLRDKTLTGLHAPMVALADQPLIGSVLTLSDGALYFDAARVPQAEAAALLARITCFADAALATPEAEISTLPILPEAERDLVLYAHNATSLDYPRDQCVHQAFEAQVAKTPDAVAVVCEGASLTYAALNSRANRAAHVLMDMGVRRGTLVGLCTKRSLDLLVGALAIQKAGGAYVPMDPSYPADRVALYIEDSACPVIVTQEALIAGLPAHTARVLALDNDGRLSEASDLNPASGVTSADLAYMIYTSGSTGRPKGVMVEHRNVANFFAGMDQRIDFETGAVWLAVTSLSFDISVLELFWTLARGFKLVLTSDDNRALVSGGQIVSAQKIDFSLYYWGNDGGVGPRKYQLLLDGARFADAHGFVAVWTPERHFHAFGGPYPNPSVTGAAVAAVTHNIGVRAGSCVAPLHHPARIAEEWAVIDNLTNGRAGLAIASGWHPDDFVLRPENTPPDNRAAMFQSIDQIRRLWRGEAVDFPTKSGSFAVQTQPRPVSKELPVWVTTAGNPATWREAGEIGANVLTHLLGQSVEEVADKIKIYHAALRGAGHDPADFTVTLMLHTYLARDRNLARETARDPMKDYLRSAAGLIKQYAWAFPAFKKPAGISNPMEIDLQSLSTEETEAILDFAFQRYFEESGLFGTVDDALARVEQLKRIGVDEVACLIDYGIAPEVVMEGLYPLAEVQRRANAAAGPAADDYSIAAQILRHGVTHLQCTPSMARMILMNDDAKAALSQVKTLLMGGEALPSALVAEVAQASAAKVLNMYGPTETTIWSTVEEAAVGDGVVTIGRPIANTQAYVLDAALQPVPLGVAGELWIGGDGVARGYWQRADLTAERFRPDPFVRPDAAAPWGARMYQTGDLVRLRADGKLDFLGRADHQVKLRGYRIELGEIESLLEAQAGISQAVVLAREDTPGDLRLVAYTLGSTPEATLRAALAEQFPDHMMPAHFVRLDALPLTPNRKVDRKALPAPQAASQHTAFVAPENGVEAQIAAVWSRVLGVPSVGSKDNFFALGGHSLLAVQAHREIRAALGAVKLSITDIFRFPTLQALAAHVDDTPKPAVAAAALGDRADARADAMARRRAMRSGNVDA